MRPLGQALGIWSLAPGLGSEHVWGGHVCMCVCGGGSWLPPSSSANWATRLWPHFYCWNNLLLSGWVFGEGMGGAQEVLESQGLHDGQSREPQGGGQGALLGAGRFFRTSMLCHQAKSLSLSEPKIYSAKFPQGSDWVV